MLNSRRVPGKTFLQSGFRISLADVDDLILPEQLVHTLTVWKRPNVGGGKRSALHCVECFNNAVQQRFRQVELELAKTGIH